MDTTTRHDGGAAAAERLPPIPWHVSEGPHLIQIRDRDGRLLASLSPRLSHVVAMHLARAITALPLLVRAQELHDQIPGLHSVELAEAIERAGMLEQEARRLVTGEGERPRPPLPPELKKRIVQMVGRGGPAWGGEWSHRVARTQLEETLDVIEGGAA